MRLLFVGLAFLTLLLGGLSAQAAVGHSGARLYAQHCAACHGPDGRGGVGAPLALPDFLATADDDYLARTIRLGRPGRVMPAFQHLSDAEVRAIVGHVRGFAQTRPAPRPAVGRGDRARGEKLYARHCASCHGAKGEGGHGTGVTFSRPRDLPILAPALNNPGFLAAASDAMIKATLVLGREGTPMGSFLEAGLSERDIDDVVAYVRAFEKQPVPAGATVLESESAVIVRESSADIPTTLERLKNAVAGVNMRLIRVAPLEEGAVEKGKENPKRYIVDACDFAFLNKALAVDPRVGLFLPCRFTVAEENGKVLVMSINPKRLSAIFNNAELNALCTQMHEIYTNIIEESTL
ncbi:cytochrome C [Sulfurifustis variabilis]|uniref:Cytochrome C n=1 Tax=Sulfurifustis variabilis TaxID=1675686 RepID=A0A1B4VAG9_9GAMM|nr:c-type cytochrome [Sulfurifustis variabilis]BAU46951.1 cytochrome C [Sulfurifustis variabilis]